MDDIAGMQVRVSNSSDFLLDTSRYKTMVVSGFSVVPPAIIELRFPPLWKYLIFSQVRSISKQGQPGVWSTPSQTWFIASRCDDEQYLDTQFRSPMKWTCVACPYGAGCKGDMTSAGVRGLFGFWRDISVSSGKLRFLPCLYPPACAGAQNEELLDMWPHQGASEGCDVSLHFANESRLCHRCAPDASRYGRHQCSKCPGYLQNVLLFCTALVILTAVLSLIVWLTIRDAGNADLSEILRKIALNHLQTVSLVSIYPFKWPSSLSFLLSIEGLVSTAGDHLVSIDCLLPGTDAVVVFYGKQVCFACLPILFIIASWLNWHICGRCCRRGKTLSGKQDEFSLHDKSVLTACVLLYLLYPSMMQQAFKLFKCVSLGGVARLEIDLEEICWQDRHLVWAAVLGVGQIICWVVGLPMLVLIVLWRQRARLYSDKIARFRYGLFFVGYRERRWYWEATVVLRKIAVVALGVFGPSTRPEELGSWCVLVLAIFIAIQGAGDPYENAKGAPPAPVI